MVDVVGVLTDSANPTDYLKKMSKHDPELVSYLGTNCPQVEMLTNGKNRKILVANAKSLRASSNPSHHQRLNLSSFGWLRLAQKDWKK